MWLPACCYLAASIRQACTKPPRFVENATVLAPVKASPSGSPAERGSALTGSARGGLSAFRSALKGWPVLSVSPKGLRFL
jgi:hypothetical protein